MTKKRALQASLGVAFLTAATFYFSLPSDEDNQETKRYQDIAAQISETYNDSSRIQNVIKNININTGVCLGRVEDGRNIGIAGWTDTCQKMRKQYLDPIASKDIKIELSTDLPSMAVLKVFKDKIVIHQNLSPRTQSLALKRALDYIIAQENDGLEYGNGEAFIIAAGEISYYKGRKRAPEILIPL
jgi:hypothetical protein